MEPRPKRSYPIIQKKSLREENQSLILENIELTKIKDAYISMISEKNSMDEDQRLLSAHESIDGKKLKGEMKEIPFVANP